MRISAMPKSPPSVALSEDVEYCRAVPATRQRMPATPAASMNRSVVVFGRLVIIFSFGVWVERTMRDYRRGATLWVAPEAGVALRSWRCPCAGAGRGSADRRKYVHVGSTGDVLSPDVRAASAPAPTLGGGRDVGVGAAVRSACSRGAGIAGRWLAWVSGSVLVAGTERLVGRVSL